MFTISKLFGKSPFSPLLTHMEVVAACVKKLNDLVVAVKEQNDELVAEIAKDISKLEHEADKAKNSIRNHLPKTLFLAIDRSHLLEILSIQDGIADQAEDAAVLFNLKKLSFPPEFETLFLQFLEMNYEAFEGVHKIIKEFHDIVESSFGGMEAQRIRAMVQSVAEKEHKVDKLQRLILKYFVDHEDEFSYSTFFLWQKIIESIAEISNLSEKLANRVRMTLELK